MNMLLQSGKIRNYQSAHARFLKPAIMNFFARELPAFFGEILREKVATELLKIIEGLNPDANTLKPGQLLWSAIDVQTRAGSVNQKLKPVILTLLCQQDIEDRQQGIGLEAIREKVIVRMLKEAHKQGALLSMRDVNLLMVQHDSFASKVRKKYEAAAKEVLPFVGSLHDAGTCVSHKALIVYKAIVEKKDPLIIARETNHSQRAVDRYLRDYHRVNTLYKDGKNKESITTLTGISINVVKQYIEIIEKYEKKA